MNLIAFGIFLIALSFQACSKEDTNKKNQLVIALSSEPNTLDPLYSTDLTAKKINNLLFSKLFRNLGSGSIENDLADSYRYKNGILSIKLKSMIDTQGNVLNSEDVIYSIQRAKQENHPYKGLYKNFIKSEFLSNTELKFIFQPDQTESEILDLLSKTSSSIYKKEHSVTGQFKSFQMYKLLEWTRNNHILLEINLPNKNVPKSIELKILPNSATAIYLFSSGKLDILKYPYYLSNHPMITSGTKKSIQGKSIQYIAINQKNPCFDIPFRKALNYGINRELIIEKIFNSLASEIYTAFPENYLPNSINKKRYLFEFNKEIAIQELKKSKCYPDILNQELDFRMRADDENKAKGAAIIQFYRDLGLKIKLKPMEKAALYKENGEGKGDLTLLTWYIDYDSPLNFVDPLFASDQFGNGGNRSFYKNEKIDSIIFQSRLSLELTPIKQSEIMEILQEEMPWVFLWSLNENYLLNPSSQTLPFYNDLLF